MIDAAPALFRSLEKPQGAQSIETVALAAISAFSAIERPSNRQTDDLAHLVLSSWPLLSETARRSVAATLADIGAPLPGVEALVSDLPARPDAASASLMGLVRRTQLRVADAAAGPCPTAAPAVQAVAASALKGDTCHALSLLAEAYAMAPGRRPDFTGDADGQWIAMALKGLKTAPGDALGILMMLRPDLATDVQALDRFAARYRSLDVDDCRRRLAAEFGKPPHDSFGRLREPSADSPARSRFGKRQHRPDMPVSLPRPA